MRTETEKVKELLNDIEDEKILDVLLCGATCESTVDLTSIKSATITNVNFHSEVVLRTGIPHCDDVCELFGGPPTRLELARAWWIANVVAPTRRFFHKIINVQYRGRVRPDGYVEHGWFIAVDILGHRVFSHYNYGGR